jgi:hypothetical protein
MSIIFKQLVFLFVFMLSIGCSFAGAIEKIEPFYLGAVSGFGSQKGGVVVDEKLLKSLGFNSFRSNMWWDGVEMERRGVYNFGMAGWDHYIRHRSQSKPSMASPAPLLILGLANEKHLADDFKYGTPFPPDANSVALEGYLNYARTFASRYKDKVPLFEVWNEWYHGDGSGKRDENTSSYALKYGATPCSKTHPHKYCWTQSILRDDKDKVVVNKDGKYINQSPTMPEHYIKLLRPTYKTVKQAAPNAKVLASAGSLTDFNWMKRFVEADGLNYTDGVSVHIYWDGTGGSKQSPEWALQRLDLVQMHLKWLVSVHSKRPKAEIEDIPIYITEVGISTFQNGDYSGARGQVRAASELVRFLLMARARSYVKGIWIHSLRDRPNPSPREVNFGLFDIDAQPKAVVSVLQKYEIADVLIKGKNFECAIDNRPCKYDNIADNGVHTQPSDGSDYAVSWRDQLGLLHRAKWKKGKGAAITFQVLGHSGI